MDLWEGLIKNTGGALATDKRGWWGIDFLQKEGKWRYKTKEELEGELTAKDHYEVRQIIKQLKTTEAYETLGVWLAADSNHTKELEILKGFAKEWVDHIQVSFLSKSEAVRAMSTTIIKKLEYPLLAMNLT